MFDRRIRLRRLARDEWPLARVTDIYNEGVKKFAIGCLVIIIAGLGAGLNEFLKTVERRLEKWKPQK